MRQILTLVIGGTSLGAGVIAGNSQTTYLLERNASISAEYCNSYRRTWDWEFSPVSEQAKTISTGMCQHNMLNKDNSDFYGCAALTYNLLRDYSSKISMLSSIESIENFNGKYKITYHTVSGHKELYCQNIIDCSVQILSYRQAFKEVVKTKRINAVLWNSVVTSNANELPSCISFESYQGRCAQECIISLEVPFESSYIVARKRLIDKFILNEKYFKNWKISSIGKEFDCIFRKSKLCIGEKHIWMNPTNHANALAAFDAGVNLNINNEVV